MDIKQVYREETELDVYAEHSLNYANYTNEYVKWLEAKINYTRCCTELKAIEDLKDFAYNNCQLHNTDQLDEIIERL